MEQTVLSINDDKMTTRGELIEYPAELSGGRNLIKNSNFQNGKNFWMHYPTVSVTVEDDSSFDKVVKVVSESERQGLYNSSYMPVLAVGQKYTLSGWVKADSPMTVYFGFDGNLIANCLAVSATPTWQYAKITKTFSTNAAVRLYGNGTFYGANLKLEKGDTATPWSPAPEDLGLSYPNWVTEFKPSISENGILAPEFDESGVLSFSINRTTAQEFIENPNL